MKNKVYKFLSIIFAIFFIILFIISLLIIYGYFPNDFDKLFITCFFSCLFFALSIYYFKRYKTFPLKFNDYEFSQFNFKDITSILKNHNFILKYKFKKNTWCFEVFIKKEVTRKKLKCISVIKTDKFNKYNYDIIFHEILNLCCKYSKKEKISLKELYLILIIEDFTNDFKDYMENTFIDFIGPLIGNSIIPIDFIPVYISLDKIEKFIKIPYFSKRKDKEKAKKSIIEMLELKEKN